MSKQSHCCPFGRHFIWRTLKDAGQHATMEVHKTPKMERVRRCTSLQRVEVVRRSRPVILKAVMTQVSTLAPNQSVNYRLDTGSLCVWAGLEIVSSCLQRRKSILTSLPPEGSEEEDGRLPPTKKIRSDVFKEVCNRLAMQYLIVYCVHLHTST